ncbi:MAG: 50S ribosomal protein L10 [Candidatus Chaera renei]|uniref:Large ribosomal subunit protein uL10 n=1 Tax=Candidatus Chaera renei TaxID=2506947 RepID=A0A4Q0AGC9_9BACT|nr:MAG: 50S ribosomal protein L10 [Candidatus Chaera renei]
MAISREKKAAQVDQLVRLLNGSKLTAVAAYAGLSVADAQKLRRQARQEGVTVKVVKNRLVKVAMRRAEAFKSSDASWLSGQLLYAFSEDETAAARALQVFAKTAESLKLQGGFDGSGQMLDATAVKELAELPSKDTLRGILVGTLSAPFKGMACVMNANLQGVIYALNARAEAKKAS